SSMVAALAANSAERGLIWVCRMAMAVAPCRGGRKRLAPAPDLAMRLSMQWNALSLAEKSREERGFSGFR
ncbi:hypothetical protein, partial [Salmonella sp. SAL04284]|uniref:hypothetical protein n=1 Tax=Salmonella sp. SAL04284 TaxID=3159862 RepID=UPI00397ACD85